MPDFKMCPLLSIGKLAGNPQAVDWMVECQQESCQLWWKCKEQPCIWRRVKSLFGIRRKGVV